MGGNLDHSRSAFGRYVAEALFWTPAALLPGPGIKWEYVDSMTARVTLACGELTQSVELRIDEIGRPLSVKFLRWSNANAEKTFRLQPFGGSFSAFQHFSGYTLPTHVEAGNHFDTDEYFPFYIVDVTDIKFPGTSQ